MTTRAVDNAGCCDIHSPKTKKMTIGAAVITALVSAILIGLGAAGILSPVGNPAALSAGGVVLALSIAAIVIVLCMTKKIVTPPTGDENARQEAVNKFIKTINEGVPDQQELWESIDLGSFEAFKAVVDKLLLAKKNILNLKDQHGCTLYDYISTHGTSEMVGYLVEKKVLFHGKKSGSV